MRVLIIFAIALQAVLAEPEFLLYNSAPRSSFAYSSAVHTGTFNNFATVRTSNLGLVGEPTLITQRISPYNNLAAVRTLDDAVKVEAAPLSVQPTFLPRIQVQQPAIVRTAAPLIVQPNVAIHRTFVEQPSVVLQRTLPQPIAVERAPTVETTLLTAVKPQIELHRTVGGGAPGSLAIHQSLGEEKIAIQQTVAEPTVSIDHTYGVPSVSVQQTFSEPAVIEQTVAAEPAVTYGGPSVALPQTFAAPAVELQQAISEPTLTYGAPAPIVESVVEPQVVGTAVVNQGIVTQKSQYHTQNEIGQATYGHSEPFQVHNAVQEVDGSKTGSFSYVNPEGHVVTTDYVADKDGYRTLHSRRRRSVLAESPLLRQTTVTTLPGTSGTYQYETPPVLTPGPTHIVEQPPIVEKGVVLGSKPVFETVQTVHHAAPFLHTTPLIHPTLVEGTSFVRSAPFITGNTPVVHTSPIVSDGSPFIRAAPIVSGFTPITHTALRPVVPLPLLTRSAPLSQLVRTPSHIETFGLY